MEQVDIESLLRGDSCRKAALHRQKRLRGPIRTRSMMSRTNNTSSTSSMEETDPRRVSVVECVGTWGAEMPFDSLSDYMLEKTMPVSENKYM